MCRTVHVSGEKWHLNSERLIVSKSKNVTRDTFLKQGIKHGRAQMFILLECVLFPSILQQFIDTNDISFLKE